MNFEYKPGQIDGRTAREKFQNTTIKELLGSVPREYLQLTIVQLTVHEKLGDKETVKVLRKYLRCLNLDYLATNATCEEFFVPLGNLTIKEVLQLNNFGTTSVNKLYRLYAMFAEKEQQVTNAESGQNTDKHYLELLEWQKTSLDVLCVDGVHYLKVCGWCFELSRILEFIQIEYLVDDDSAILSFRYKADDNKSQNKEYHISSLDAKKLLMFLKNQSVLNK
jgi:hypothetical protein